VAATNFFINVPPFRYQIVDPAHAVFVAIACSYLTKLRYEASASIWFADNLLAILGIGAFAVA